MSLSPSRSETNYWIIGHASSTSEDVYSSVSKGSVSGSSRISSCDFRTACPVLLETVSCVIFWTVNWNVQCTTCERFLNHICRQFSPGIQDPLQNCFWWWCFQIPSCCFFVNTYCRQPFTVLLCAGRFKWFVPTYVWRLYVLGTTYGDNHAVDFVGFERVGNTVLKVTFVRVPS